MANNRYIITRSNYTIKEKHKTLKDGSSIYERDYMTTTNLGGWNSGSIPYGENNFKFVHNQLNNRNRSFNNGNWLVNNCNGISSSTWTLDCIGKTQPKDESHIVIKPNKNSFNDFAYFGSCVELLNVSLKNIINFFPGELYISSDKYTYINNGNRLILGSDAFTNPVVVYNPFNIDIIRTTVNDEIKQDPNFNDLRYFAESYNKYEFISPDEEQRECTSGWEVITKNKKCYDDGELISNITINFDDDVLLINEYYFKKAS